MVSVTVKLFAVACVLALLLTVFRASVDAAEAGAEELVPFDVPVKRLTMSETSARDPMVASSGSIAHLAWIDSSGDGDAILWKRTSGDGSYTSPEALSQRFESIVDMDISAAGDMIVVAYAAVTNGTASVYIVCSSDGQRWGSNYLLGEGGAVAASALGDRAYICMATSIDGNDTVAVIGIDIEDGVPSNASMLVALPFAATLVDLLADESGAHYAAAGEPSVVIYGHIGEELSEPVMIHGQSDGAIADVKLLSVGGRTAALIASNLPGGSLISMAESFDGPTHWSENILVNGEGVFSDLSYARHGDGIIVAWANSSTRGAIEAMEMRNGQVTRTWKVVEGAVSSPSVFVENDGISCTWAEDGADLYTISNIQFRVTEFDELLSFAASLDEAAFRPDVSDAREHFLDDLQAVKAYMLLNDAAAAENAIVHVLEHIDGFVILSRSDDLLLSTSICENIYGKLQAVRNEIKNDGLRSDAFAQWAIEVPSEHGEVPKMTAFDAGASRSLATLEGCSNLMSVSGEPGGDAPGTIGSALVVEPGRFTGSVSGSDTADCFKFKVYNPPYHNQMIYIDLDVPSGFDLDMKLYSPSGTLVRTAELGTGYDEHIEYLTSSVGDHVVQVYWASGSGTANYEVKVEVAGGLDYFYMDVGESGDTAVQLPGLSILDDGGWSGASGSKRTGAANSTILLNLFSESYQSNTSYLVGFQYTAWNDVTVSVYNGGGWVNIGELGGSTSIKFSNLVVPSEHLYDALPETAGMNVMLRFSSSIALDYLDAVAYSYTTGAAPGASYHNPGVGFESGWTFDGTVANGSAGATMLVNVPVQTMVFTLEITYSDPAAYIEVQQLSFDGYVTIGNLYRWGNSAVISLQRGVYYDADASAPGYNIRLRFVSSISNVTSVTMRPCDQYTVVGGVYDDSGRYRNPGINIYNNGHWSSVLSDGGRTYRSTTDGSALFFVNGPVSGNFHEVELVYRSSSSFTISQWTGSSFVDVKTIQASSSWTTASFRIDPSTFVDYMWGTQLNILFKIGTASVSVAELHLLIDSDNDGAVDRMEADRTANRYLDPFSDDTDSDGLKDADEGYFGTIYGHTIPWDPDTDGDGLMDGAERWSQSWSTDKFYKVPNGSWSDRAIMPITIPSIPASVEITAVRVHVGIVTDRAQDIEVWMYKVGSGLPNLCLYDQWNVGANVFETYIPLSPHYTISLYRQGGTFEFMVADQNYAGSDGQVQYVILQLEGKTNPLVKDTDGDGIWDGEEVSFGEDGWITNPVLYDTDGDGIWDRDEIEGITPCNQPLDPICADTDGDGFRDNVDKYLGDMMLHVNINFLNLWEDINWGNVHDIFFVLTYYDDVTDSTIALSTERLYDVYTHEDRYFNFNYYIQVDDTGTSKGFVMMAVADNAGNPPAYDDIKLDMEDTDPNHCDYPFTFYYSNGHTEYYSHGDLSDGWFNVNSECEVGFFVETAIAPKSNLIIVNSTEENSDLYVIGANNYRYTADGQVYMLYVTVPGNSAHFSSGVNTIIVPRYLALESQLNSTLASPSGSELSGGEFYSTDGSQSFSSGHIVAVINKSMSNQEAENLLNRLTHDSTNAQIANAVMVGGEAIYRLHLPADVQSRLPYNIQSSAIGDPYDFLAVGEVLEFVFDCLVSIGTALYNLAEMVYEAGVKFVCGLTASAIQAIQETVTKIVNAFQAFVTWAIEFICDTFNALIAQPLQGLYDGLEGWANGLVSLVAAAAYRIESGTDNASASFPIFQYILASEVFKMLIVIGISLFAVITAASFLGPCGFIASLVAPFLVNMLVSGMTAAAFAVAGVADVSSWVLSTLVDILGNDLVGGMAGIMGATIGTIGWIAETMMLDTAFETIKGFVWSSIGAIISWIGTMVTDWTQSLILNSIGLVLALKGCYEIFINPNMILRANPTALSIMKGVTAIEAGISIFELTTTVASHE